MAKKGYTAIVDLEIVLTMEGGEKCKVKMEKQDKKVWVSILHSMYKKGFETTAIEESKSTNHNPH